MSQRFVPDRNTVTFGPAVRNEKTAERDIDDIEYKVARAEAKQPTTVVTDGGTLVIPGTYVPKVGLPAGTPYVVVLGNLLEDYPVDLSLTGLVRPNRLERDLENVFGQGVDTIIGPTFDGNVLAYNVPGLPMAIGGPLPNQGLVSRVFAADGTLYQVTDGEVLGAPDYGFTMSVMTAPSVWSAPAFDPTYSVLISAGPCADAAGAISMRVQPTFGTVGTTSVRLDLVDGSGAITTTLDTTLPFSMLSGLAHGRIENGWMLISARYYDSGSGTFKRRLFARPAIISTPVAWIALSESNVEFHPACLSITSAGTAWATYTDPSALAGSLWKYDLVTGIVTTTPGILTDPTGVAPLRPYCVNYVSDSVCLVGGFYNVLDELGNPFLVPMLTFVAFDELNVITLTQLDFPDLALPDGVGLGQAGFVSAVKLTENVIVAHAYAGSVTEASVQYSLLYGLDTSALVGVA